jgi:hypothetical protein
MPKIRMIGLKADATELSITTTAGSLLSFMKSADATLTDAMVKDVDYIRINSTGTMGYLVGGTPTATVGMDIAANETVDIYGVHPDKLIVIGRGGTITANVQAGNQIN